MSEDTTIDEVVQRFVSAEQVLIDLRARQAELLEATERFTATDAELRTRTTSALEALEDARSRLRDQMKTSSDVAKDTSKLHASLGDAARQIGLVLETLRTIDPAAMTRDIAELRRGASQNAAELRDLRRALTDLQRNHESVVAAHESLTKTHSSTRYLLPVGAATLVASVAALVLAVVR